MYPQNPIGVFDAGIGSYDFVRKLSIAYPEQDIIYFADRANFPYGNKSRKQLLGCIEQAFEFFQLFSPKAIVLASNAPSIMVLQDFEGKTDVPVLGVFPPIRQALKLSMNGHIGVLGVDSLISSAEMISYVDLFGSTKGKISLFEASDLVELVETGEFLNNEVKVQDLVERKMWNLPQEIDVFTLSSTHLPWLRKYFENACPDKTFLDPADEVIEYLRPFTKAGNSNLFIVASQSERFSLDGFKDVLNRLGVDRPVYLRDEFVEEFSYERSGDK